MFFHFSEVSYEMFDSFKCEIFEKIINSKRADGGKSNLSFANHKLILLFLTAVAIFMVALPFAQQTIINKRSEPYSEMWLLGQQHTADNYPSTIEPNHDYTVFLDVNNNMGKMVQYMVKVWFFNTTPSTQTTLGLPVYSITAAIANEETWALPVTFSIDYAHDETTFGVNVTSIKINSLDTKADGTFVAWNSTKEGRYGYLHFELWAYDTNARNFKNFNCSVDLRFNMTAPILAIP
jgi:uncharacterized membrane protein